MERQVRLFIEGIELDLFNDEQIEVNSSSQNIADISKAFTDISKSFTVPGTSNNNQVFEHFYENSIDGTLNYNERRDAFIEVDLTTFRRGRVQLDKANIQNGKIQSYQLTFYGEVLSLKDKFGEDKLKDLDFSAWSHPYNFNTVTNRITSDSTDWDVGWPLITSNRLWEYNSANGYYTLPNYVISTITSNDIHTNVGAIDYRELFPAVKLSVIMQAIQAKYNITFDSNFFADEKFIAAYLWFKNSNAMKSTSEPFDIDIQAINYYHNNFYNVSTAVDQATNSIRVQYLPQGYLHRIIIEVNTTSSTTTPYHVDVYRNGSYLSTFDGVNAGVHPMDILNVLGLDDTYTYKIRTDAVMTGGGYTKYQVSTTMYPGTFYDEVWNDFVFNVSSFNVNLSGCAPDMKVVDFFSGVLKEFNLCCVPTEKDVYQVEPLQDWYAGGAIVDITHYTDMDSIDIDRVKLYKKIAMKYQTSESCLNKFYYQANSKEYGNTEYQYPYDGGEFTIDVPFENLMFNHFASSDLQVGYCLNSSLAPYIPKPCILYKYPMAITVAYDIHYKGIGSSSSYSTRYNMFGQDFFGSDNVEYSLNFAPETSTAYLYPVDQSIFATYYFAYLANLYNLKNRYTTIKAILPISLLTGLRLNDRLIIRDKRYIINDMNINLTTGEVKFNLLNDFMPVGPDNIIRPLPRT